MKPKLHPLLCAALALGAATATLCAQTPNPPAGDAPAGGPPPPPPGHHGPPPPSPLFRALDANHDGTISADEIANAPAVLKALAGESGQLTRESLRPPRPEHDDRGPRDDSTHPHRPRPDARGDDNGGSPAPRPPRPDGDHGLAKPDASPSSSPDASPAPGGAPADGPDGRRHHGPPPHGDRLFDALDTNHDGVISADEIAAAATSLKKADTNGDGVIDRRDFRPPPPPPPAPAD